jgi:hypothetical protein
VFPKDNADAITSYQYVKKGDKRKTNIF